MAKVVIVGAGVMGSALTIPLADNGHEINLWGTRYDQEVIESIRKTQTHPRLGLALPANLQLFALDEMAHSVKEREIILLGVASGGIRSVMEMLEPFLEPGMVIVNVAKGLEEMEDGEIITIPQVIERALPEEIRSHVPVVAIGGPSKAREVALRVPTSVVFASSNIQAAQRCRKIFTTPRYTVQVTSDVIGVEVGAALKNGYAIALGMCDGLKKREGVETMNNTKSTFFAQAAQEMALLSRMLGGRSSTVMGLAGVGDLYVTSAEGRNITLGELIGSGLPTSQALEEMRKRRETVEGYPAIGIGYRLARKLEDSGKLRMNQLPLLKALWSILYEDKPAHEILFSLRLMA
ncbi:glycerol-3-phosphate dehydrogenase (NAD(P)+) [Candidatus Hakubella thermalkaliphila]|uniref:Glycerol-3-phosphate dehydrogenase [NAD(P)+] n=1 Tax=Candidatus Hakubella thermalkaliphila TaxID=2754717 RepID=A0A6V8NMB0_9ACTN|nr:NAD(P)-binding domain-containing protein [Candidatus Hakubella thermalkaliphila]GFP21462.1 glycerol-3-phosphate dehydrogenase (NAD(P)+) [Candidatus Hakubella thermalkaliphila]